MGTYTKSKRNVLLCACSKSEAYLVKNAVYQVDDSAFVMFTETSEVLEEIKENWAIDQIFEPSIDPEIREKKLKGWHKAVKYSFDWAKED